MSNATNYIMALSCMIMCASFYMLGRLHGFDEATRVWKDTNIAVLGEATEICDSLHKKYDELLAAYTVAYNRLEKHGLLEEDE